MIVGDSSRYINPINARTSTGPPYNMKKFYHYARVDGEAAMSPEMALRADEIKRVLASGDIPIPFARCVLKDEVVKPGKPARVFTMLAAVMNCTIAETIGAVFELMRRNPRFFESMVGIDMSGNGGDLLVEFLSSVDKVLDELEEHDVSKLDKCWLPEMWDAVGLSFGFVAAAIGIPHCPVETLV